MQCPGCNAKVVDGSKFCSKCGSALPHACPNCGHAVLPEDRFCSECGTSVLARRAGAGLAEVPALASANGSGAERRQLTIMFCDMVGSSALSTRLDAEEQADVIAAFHTCCAKEIKTLAAWWHNT